MSQRSTAVFLYRLTMRRSRTLIKRRYRADWWNRFKNQSNKRFRELISEFPDIGDSMFAFNYCYAPGYVAWYTSMEILELDPHERDVLMLQMNEKMLLTVPKLRLYSLRKEIRRRRDVSGYLSGGLYDFTLYECRL